jgi:hypothetical protein
MKGVARFSGLAIVLSAAVVVGGQGQKGDPRVGLKPGFTDAGTAAMNMELVASVPRPPGFFDPANPAGLPSAPERAAEPGAAGRGAKPAADPPAGRGRGARGAEPPDDEQPAGRGRGGRGGPAGPGPLDFANSDLAFRGNELFIGNFSGFNAYDISNPRDPKLIVSIVCPGGQGDVSVHGNLLFMSVEQTRGRLDCGVGGVQGPVSDERFRGVRIFDITDLRSPKQVAAVQTCRGSHTHTLLADPKDTANLYVYGSGTSSVRSAEELAGCSGADWKEDPNTALFSIDVIQVPLANPAEAKIVSRPRIFADPKTGALAGLWQGGDHGPGTQSSRLTNQCHDITVYPEIGLAAGACSGNGILLDISDPVNPKRLDEVVDKSFAYWHSATFNNDGTKVVFTDEWGGGTRARCRAEDPREWGANAIFDIVDRKLQFRSYYKLPAPQTATENCVAHNGSIVPAPGRDLMVQSWYQGGISVFDFTDSSSPFEIAYFDRGPIDAENLIVGGHWSAYWYNGHVYGAEIARGLDVLRLTPGEHLTQNEVAAAEAVRYDEFNPQHQPKVTWPGGAVAARAYLDQLARGTAVPADRIAAVRAALDAGDTGQLATLAGQLEAQAAKATGVDATRLKALAAAIR